MTDWMAFAMGLIPRSLFLAASGLICLAALRDAPTRARHGIAAGFLLLLGLLPALAWCTPRWEWRIFSRNEVASQFTAGGSVAGLAWLWLMGTVLFGFRILRAARRVSRLAGDATEVSASDPARAILRRFLLHFDLKRPVRLAFSNDVPGPVVCGLLRPTILLPAAAKDWPARRLERVFAHECAHLFRRDLWMQWMAQWIRAIYWWNPLICRLHRHLEQSREMAADQLALSATDCDRDGYARELLGIANEIRRVRNHATAAAALIGVASSKLEDRIRRIVENRDDDPGPPRWMWIATGLLAACLVLTCLCILPAPVGEPSSEWTEAEITRRLSADPFPGN